MTYEQEKHLSDVIVAFAREVDGKYRAGQAEHGGDLFRKPGMLKFLREETLDFITYTHTLRDQILEIRDLVAQAVADGDVWAEEVLGRLDALLSEEPEA